MPDLEQDDCSLESTPLQEPDLRRHPRYLSLDGGVLRLAVRPEFRSRRGVLVDVSTGGIGFLLEDALDVGTVLVLELQGLEGLESMTRLARVRNIRPRPAPARAPWLSPRPGYSRFFRSLVGLPTQAPKPQAWFVGCEFDRPLSETEMKQLLAYLKSLSSEPEA
jgi:hypothetical protein